MSPQNNNKIEKELFELEKYFLSGYKLNLINESNGLLTGLGGIIFLQSLFLQNTKNILFEKEIINNINQIIKNIENGEINTTTYCNGLAGIGYLFHYLSEKDILSADINEFLKDVDLILENQLKQMLKSKNFDILHGALGLGLYFLKRGNTSLIENLIYILLEHAEVSSKGICWKLLEKNNSKVEIIDLGLAHGNAAILYFFVKCFQKEILPEVCESTINKILNFYLNIIQDFSFYGSFFPNKVIKDISSGSEINEHFSRLAWCYGDLGILHTLFLAAKWVKNKSALDKIISLLISTTKRTEKKQTMVIDACFCHGSSGIGYIYYSIYKTTKNTTFLSISEYWMQKTLLSNISKNDTPCYLTYFGNTGWVQSPDLLNGVGGVSLFYMTLIKETLNTDINELFFLS